MDKILEFDLNDIVSKQVSKKIEGLENRISQLQDKNIALTDKVLVAENKLNNVSSLSFLFDYLREEFSNIVATPKVKDDSYGKCKAYNQFMFIHNILLYIFNISPEYKGWYGQRAEGNLRAHLAVNYYSNKEILISLLKILKSDWQYDVKFIESFQMPFDYSKDKVINFVNSPKYNTNGCIQDISEYWINRGAGIENMPYSLMFKNPHILEEDVFTSLIETINRRRDNYHYLFALPVHNSQISKEQIERLGECLTKLVHEVFSYSDVELFIKNNFHNFNKTTLDYLATLVDFDNHYRNFHWERFPTEYQMRFLERKSFDEVLKILTNYSCKWTVEEKESFLTEYLSKNNGTKFN